MASSVVLLAGKQELGDRYRYSLRTVMRYIATTTLFFAVVAGAVFAQSQQSNHTALKESDSEKKQAPKIKSLSVADFANATVIGHLGRPLGSVVRITGVAVDGDTKRIKRYMGKTLLEIHTVDGNELDKRILFEFPRAKKSVAMPEPGDMFDYYAHEYGAFDGVVVPPKELEIESPTIAHDGFYYRPCITIHKSLK